jgi:cbb3-type cytochrome oxidase subunit 3
MHKIVLRSLDNPELAIWALAIFLICFVLHTLWTFKKENKAIFESISLLPLEELPSKTNQTSSDNRRSHERK